MECFILMPVNLLFGHIHFRVTGCLNCFFVLSFTVEISVPYTEYIRRRVLRRLTWVYTVCHCPFYETLGINGLTVYPKEAIVWIIKHSVLLYSLSEARLLCQQSW